MRLLTALAGSALLAPLAPAQFAGDRNTPAPAFGGGTPAATAPAPTRAQPQPQPPAPPPTSTARIAPVPTTIDPAADQPHPWAVRLDHGPWMICVRAYAGPNSRGLAEKLVQEIRTTYKTAAYVFERNGAERKAELAQIEAIREEERKKAEPFLRQQEQAKKEAEASGRGFIPTQPKLKVPKPYRETPEQWAVLIGGFKTDTDARKALDVVRRFQDPADTSLMDRALVGGETGGAKPGEGQWKSEWNYVNPYRGAMVVPNPMQSAANRDEKGKLDPDVVKMNEENPRSLLKAKKPWTLLVRTFTVPIRFAGKDEKTDGTLLDKVATGMARKPNLYAVTANEAVSFAEAVGSSEMKHGPFKVFVLHHRTGSLVTVGEYDAPDDPELLRVQQLLSGITFEIRDKDQKPMVGKDGRPEVQRMFDKTIAAFPVPKY